jgi:hypothetical protein
LPIHNVGTSGRSGVYAQSCVNLRSGSTNQFRDTGDDGPRSKTTLGASGSVHSRDLGREILANKVGGKSSRDAAEDDKLYQGGELHCALEER